MKRFLLTMVMVLLFSTPAWALSLSPFYYGDHTLEGVISDADDGAVVTARIDQKKYTGKVSAGKFSIKVPGYPKINAAISVSCPAKSGTETEKAKVMRWDSKYYQVFPDYIFAKSTKVTGKIYNAHKGDILRVKIGKKTFKTTIRSDKREQKFTVKIKKSAAGSKVTLTFMNRHKQKLSVTSAKVYSSNATRTGMTIKKVRLLAYWGDPTKIQKSGNTQKWCYDDNNDGVYDTYLYFKDGKVSGWDIK